MAEGRFRYRREDFGELPVKLNHLRIILNFLADRVDATGRLDMTASTELGEITLDARDLTILGVEWLSGPEAPVGTGEQLRYDYREEENRLVVVLPRPVKPGERFFLGTLSSCHPSDNVLEGIYKDATPAGAPQQYISQCQQWGFQRIMPILDDCRAKCTMTTTLEADAAYTHLISNGNISRTLNPEGRPVPKPGDPSRQVITYENPIPMAPYLFLACAGTWDMLADSVTYPSGKSVRLEYLVPPGRVDHVRIPMEILKQSVLWVAKTQGYEYAGDTYRTITMNKSNFGGMENMGNTTIVTDAALMDEHTLDQSLMYAHAVIVHEFEHNQCGSETTMETPFDVWLNEAYTVDVERQFMASVFDPAFARLNQVDSIRNPLLGPLAMEDGGHVGRIVREGFNDPDELIDGVTYVKAAEVIRMLRLVIGRENFQAGKSLYFSRYRFGNANTDQFFQCFEEVSGLSLEQFKRGWLYRIGYPRVRANSSYDSAKKEYRIRFTQEPSNGGEPFHVPVALALVDGEGRDLEGSERVFQLREAEAELVLGDLAEPPAFASIARDYSFYGTFQREGATSEMLARQAMVDPNGYNRVDAMRQLTDRQRIALLLDPAGPVDEEWLDLYGKFIAAPGLSPALRAFFLRIDEQPMDRNYSTWYPELVVAREKLMEAVNRRYRGELLTLFEALDTYRPLASPKDGIEERMLKHVLLDLIAVEDSAESQCLIKAHLDAATTDADRVAALLALNRGSMPERRAILRNFHEAWRDHLSAYANYLRVISSGTREDVFDMIEEEKNRPTFNITQPTWCRALFLPMAVNNKMVWTERGIGWVADAVAELAPLNATTASRLLNTFQHVKRLKPGLREKVAEALQKIVDSVPPDVSRTIHGQASAYLG